MWDQWKLQEFLIVALCWNLWILVILLVRSIHRTLRDIQNQGEKNREK